ncbi:MAG: hypothetical protein HY858_15375 [Candidatus Solibacter usitatus]|nr:hypothetical protein [Candidatus Solibacter usitatus]
MAHHDHPHAADNYLLSDSAWTKVRNSLVFIALVSWIAVAAGFALDRQQAHFSYLVAFLYFVSVTLGAMFYVMVQHLTGSAWSVTVRRLMENIMRAIPLGLLLIVPVFLGTHYMYEWGHAGAAHDPILSKKLNFLNDQWFVIRGLIVLSLWSLFSWRLYSISRRQDGSGSLSYTKAAEKWSAPGVLVLFLSGSLASFDWIMSLDPHWWSTMFGVYFIAGGALAFMAILIAICLGLRSAGYLTNSIREEHYHDLGKWLFALTVFWAYISFSQYMLIWYGNLPEENVWFQRRLVGSWAHFRPLLIVCHFIIPFFALMPRASKRNLKLLGFFAGWMIVMHYCDLFWQVMPVLHAKGFVLSWMDPAAWLAVGSTYALVFWAGFRRKPLVPVGDPRLKQCLAFHNA